MFHTYLIVPIFQCSHKENFIHIHVQGFGFDDKLSKVKTSKLDIFNIWIDYCASNNVRFNKQNLWCPSCKSESSVARHIIYEKGMWLGNRIVIET